MSSNLRKTRSNHVPLAKGKFEWGVVISVSIGLLLGIAFWVGLVLVGLHFLAKVW